jgi:23S rRNA A1618 N6-methylase RlmF
MSPARSVLLAVVSVGSLSTMAAAQAPAELQEAIRQRTEAVAKSDTAIWNRLTAEDFTVVLPNGAFLNKAERLEQFKTQPPMGRGNPERVQLKHYGETYVRRFLSRMGWVLEVWTKEAGTWQVVAVQVTPVAKK